MKTKKKKRSSSAVGLRIALVIVAAVIWHWTQSLLGARTPFSADATQTAAALLTQGDGLLTLVTPLHAFFASSPNSAAALLIASSVCIDALVIFVLVRFIAGDSVRPFLGLVLLFALRQLLQALTALPPPEGMIWFDPGFPSLFVTYGVGNDLFFSGHTALAVFGAVELSLYRRNLWILGAAVALFEIVTVLILRAHYTMDVFAGAITALWIAYAAKIVSPLVDRWLVRFTG